MTLWTPVSGALAAYSVCAGKPLRPVTTCVAARPLQSSPPKRLLLLGPDYLTALKALGFRPGFRYEKYRTSFRLNSLHIDLDETPIGTFLELEGSHAAINRTARTLGFRPRDYLRSTYWTLYAADCRRRHRKPQ